jgi:hypothetical protein
MDWTMPNTSVGKPNIQDIRQEGAYLEEMKKSVADQFAVVMYRSETSSSARLKN